MMRLLLPPLAGAMVLVAVLAPASAQAYPWMLRHEYTTCAQCHADPSGGGLLTEYGRAQSEILLRTRYGAPADEPGRVKDFFFGAVPTKSELLLGGAMRGMWLRSSAGGQTQSRAFPMQLDLSAQVSSGKLRVNAGLGYGNERALPAAVVHGETRALLSRHHWVGLVLDEDEAWMVRAGRMNLPFGLRSVEHTSLVRESTRTDLNVSQQHGLALAYGGEATRGELMAIVGNLQLSPASLRERGYAGFLERTLASRWTLGASSLATHTDATMAALRPQWRHAHGLFTRWAPVRPVMLLAEGDVLLRSQQGSAKEWGWTGMVQLDVEPLQGVHLLGTVETLRPDFEQPSRTYGYWAGVAWFFAPHADLRLDGIWRRTDGQAVRTVALQLHLFL